MHGTIRRTRTVVFLCALIGSAPAAMAQPDWRPIFNGKDLTGWTLLNGTAKYTVEEGAIVGATVNGSPNSFLATSEVFGDFILEYEARVESNMNSGVQIRGLSDPAYKDLRPENSRAPIKLLGIA